MLTGQLTLVLSMMAFMTFAPNLASAQSANYQASQDSALLFQLDMAQRERQVQLYGAPAHDSIIVVIDSIIRVLDSTKAARVRFYRRELIDRTIEYQALVYHHPSSPAPVLALANIRRLRASLCLLMPGDQGCSEKVQGE
jgi:hypothetical protein